MTTLAPLSPTKEVIPSNKRTGKIAYIMSRFPKISETFILFEILEHERQGRDVGVYPLLREKQPVVHPEAERITNRAHFQPFISKQIFRANLHYFLRRPEAYIKMLAEVLGGTISNRKVFIGTLGIIPKSVRFAYLMEQQGISHVHAHFCNHPAMSALIINRLTDIPFSFTAHGSDLHKDKTMLDKKVEASTFAATVSSYNKSAMLTKCGRQANTKIHIVHCGIDPDIFKPRDHALKNGLLRILCVASFEEVKGHKYLVRACEILKSRKIDFVCDFIGEGPVRGKIEDQIKQAKLSNQIIVHGSLPRLEVAKKFKEAHVKALVSVPTTDGKREGVPVVLMEAMACELPVISSQLSGIPELVDHDKTGILVAPRDVEGIANALEKMYRDPKLSERLGKAGRQKVLKEYNLIINTERLAKLINNVTSQSI